MLYNHSSPKKPNTVNAFIYMKTKCKLLTSTVLPVCHDLPDMTSAIAHRAGY